MYCFNNNTLKYGLMFWGLNLVGSIGIVKLVENSNNHIKMQNIEREKNKNKNLE